MNALVSQVLTGAAGSLIISGLAKAPSTVPCGVLWCLAVRISPAHWPRIYESELLPRLLETEAETGHGWLWRLGAGTRCAALLWREQTAPRGSQRTPPGLGPEEDVVVVVHRHPFVLALPALVCRAGLAAAAALTFAMHPTAGTVQSAWLAWGVLLGWLTWRVLSWKLSILASPPGGSCSSRGRSGAASRCCSLHESRTSSCCVPLPDDCSATARY